MIKARIFICATTCRISIRPSSSQLFLSARRCWLKKRSSASQCWQPRCVSASLYRLTGPIASRHQQLAEGAGSPGEWSQHDRLSRRHTLQDGRIASVQKGTVLYGAGKRRINRAHDHPWNQEDLAEREVRHQPWDGDCGLSCTNRPKALSGP